MDRELLRYKAAKLGHNLSDVAEMIGVNQSTFYRKLGGVSDFTRNEILLIRNALQLTSEEVDAIFFGE